MANGRVVVVGSSSGGVRALQLLAAQLGPDFPAPILVVQHIGSHPSILPSLLVRNGRMPAAHALDGERIGEGRIHVAPPDMHMILDGHRIRLTHGPKENHTRPAIDPLFRSAAGSRGADVIGVLLTGSLDDGTAGLQAIRQRGGTVVVQDPDDAEASSMPASALRYVEVDHVVGLAELGALLRRLALTPAGASVPIEPKARHESEIFLGKGNPMDHLKAIGRPSTFVCPECKGALWEVDGVQPRRYRCHTGHGFTLRTLHHAQANGTDEAIWSALRALQEKEMLLRAMAEQASAEEAAELTRQAEEAGGHAETLRALVERVPPAVD